MKQIFEYVLAFAKWVVLALLIGLFGGIVGSGFHMSIDFVTEFRIHNPQIIFLLPLGGLAIVWLYGRFKNQGRLDTDRVLDGVGNGEKVPIIMLPLIFVSSVITHLLGGSAGREGAALQLGGTIGYNVGKLFRLDKSSTQMIVMCGMSAVFSALFGTPLTATVFALEVVFVGTIHYSALLSCVISALVASEIAYFFGISPVSFAVDGFGMLTPDFAVKVAVLALLCGLLSIVFCETIHRTELLGKKFLPNSYIRTAVGASLIIALTLILRTYDYNGAGMDVIKLALEGTAKPEAFAIKLIFTAITLASGFKGGEIVPAFFVGSTFGCVVGSLLGLDPAVGGAVGFVALFCGAVNCPLASIFLALEVFGSNSVPIMALVCAISFMVSGKFSLYKSQRFAFSKINMNKL